MRSVEIYRPVRDLKLFVAEAVATGLLLAAIVGSGIMAENLAGGNDAVALLGNTLGTVATLIVLILVFGPISGAHLNPAISLVFLLRREIAASTFMGYVVAQTCGAVVGVFLAHAMFDLSILQASTHVRASAGQWLSEAVATFGLAITVFSLLREKPSAVPYAVGLYIASAYWFTASTSFANPAVTVGRSLSNTFSGISPSSVLAFVMAQIAGALLATVVLGSLKSATRPAAQL
jgi:glycerol uptake facilitator-like aquaporin